jgi:hypothetical protein
MASISMLSLIGILIVALLIMVLRLSGWTWSVVFYCLTLTLFAVTLSQKWSTAVTHTGILGGLIPDSDASGYYFDAIRLLEGRQFSNFSTNRPISTAFVAVLLWIAQGHLQIVYAILSFLLATACFILSREVARTHGVLAALLVLFLLFLFSIKFIGTLFTENIGLALGSLGIALLWRSNQRNRWYMASLGLLLITLALFARAGALLVLPMLLIWGVLVSFREGSRRWLTPLLMGTALVIGYAVNSLLIRTVGSSQGGAFSNFALVLYGQVVGGKGWGQVIIDYPDLQGHDIFAREFANLVYARAWSAFLSNPSGLGIGLLKSWADFFTLGSIGQFSFIPGNNLALVVLRAVLTALWLAGLVACMRWRKEPQRLLLLAATVGIMLSVIFVPPIDSDRMRVYAATISIPAIVIALCVSNLVTRLTRTKWLARIPLTQDVHRSGGISYFVPVAALFALGVSLSPIALRSVSHSATVSTQSCSTGQKSAVIRVISDAALQLASDDDHTRVPVVRVSDFRNGLSGKQYSTTFLASMNRLDAGMILFRAIDLRDTNGYLFVADHAILANASGIVYVCGKTISEGGDLFFAQIFKPDAQIREVQHTLVVSP